MIEASPERQGRPTEPRKSARIAENINEEYQIKAQAIQHAVKGYREIKQDIFVPDQLLQILDMKVNSPYL